MAELYTRFDNVFFEKTRLSLLTLLYREEKMTFNVLKEQLALSDGALYTHLEKLIQAGYASKSKEAAGLTVQTVYCLTDFGAGEFLAYLDFLREVIRNGEEK
ncbi:transcriptional regulator [Spirochaeta dissipatitropha]